MQKAAVTALVFIGWFALLIHRYESSSVVIAAQSSPPCSSTTNAFGDCRFRDSNNNIICEQFDVENYTFNTGLGLYSPNPQHVFCQQNFDCGIDILLRAGCACDNDGDSYPPPSCGGQDCDDTNPNINPEAEEICANFEDDDCDDDTDFYSEGQYCNTVLQGAWDEFLCYCWTATPIIVDPIGNGFLLTGLGGGVNFDLDGNGSTERVSWTNRTSDDAFLALDRNGNGTIDSGAELFGSSTQQGYSHFPNGFLALSEFDKAENGGNADGRIDNNDSVFSALRLWRDSNHNGISEASELRSLISVNLFAMSLDFSESRRTDKYGNQFRYRARVYDARGSQFGRWAWDVILLRQQ